MKKINILWLVALFAIGCRNHLSERDKFDILIQNVNVVDTRNGQIINDQDIGIVEGRIARIAPHDGIKGWTGAKTVEASNKFIIPGL